jgi:hypothetical protein
VLHPGAILGLVENQLQLPLVGDIAGRRDRPADSDWRIDEPTRRVGRRGLAEARAALARASALDDTRADAA